MRSAAFAPAAADALGGEGSGEGSCRPDLEEALEDHPDGGRLRLMDHELAIPHLVAECEAPKMCGRAISFRWPKKLPSLLASPTPIGQWLQGLMARAHKNTVVVALANKLARIVWAVLRQGGTYRATAVKAI